MPQAPSRAIMLFGTDEVPAESRILTAGPLTAELDAGNLRYIRFGGREAIRAISYVVRDKLWGTYSPDIRDMQVEESAESFTVTYTACCCDDDQSFTYHARITGHADGSLRFEGDGTADSDFLTNRTGFVVLHGVDGVSGEPVSVEDVDGKLVDTRFPDLINPTQPILDIRALTHQVAPGLEVTCTMLGDTFEMEDQRNWTDASYKTYVRPLGLPFPYILNAGETLEQAIELRFQGAVPRTAATGGNDDITVEIGGDGGTVPSIGMGLEWQDVDAAMARLDQCQDLRPAFLSGFFDTRYADASALRAFSNISDRLGCDLALEVVLPGLEEPDSALEEIAAMLKDVGAQPAAVAVSPSGDLGFVAPGSVFPDMSAYRRLYEAARRAFPDSRIGGGTFAYFTELNRKPPPLEALDYVVHTTSAIVHAADDRSTTETIEALPSVIKSGRTLIGDLHYRIGPMGLGTRTSPFGGDPTPNQRAGRVTMCRNDPRQRGLLGAAWYLGAAARAAEGGVDSLTLGAPIGDHGLVHHPGANAQPWFDEAGGLFPVFHVLAGLYLASGRPRRAATVSQARNLQVLATESETGVEVWMANLTGETQTIQLKGMPGSKLRVAALDEASFASCVQDAQAFDRLDSPASTSRLTLQPYAVARCRAAE